MYVDLFGSYRRNACPTGRIATLGDVCSTYGLSCGGGRHWPA